MISEPSALKPRTELIQRYPLARIPIKFGISVESFRHAVVLIMENRRKRA